MSRIWQIKEQVVEDPSTKLRLEFSSVYTDEVNAGNEPPLKDELLLIRLWTSDRTRVATFTFERNGRFVRCEVEPLPSQDRGMVGADTSFTQGYLALPQAEQPGISQAEMDRRIANEPGVRRPEAVTAQGEQPDEAAFGKAAFSGL